jgi:hypothetical protein
MISEFFCSLFAKTSLNYFLFTGRKVPYLSPFTHGWLKTSILVNARAGRSISVILPRSMLIGSINQVASHLRQELEDGNDTINPYRINDAI